MRNIILGSQSPRRRELMAGLDIPFSSICIDADESFPSHLQAGEIPMYISRAKARAYEEKLTEADLLITSDTIVWLNGHMLGKPLDKEEAKQMLSQLSGQTHQVYTAVCFTWKNKDNNQVEQEEWVDSTDVTFRELTKEEIEYYVEKICPLTKQGHMVFKSGLAMWV
jgi:septum formation protein